MSIELHVYAAGPVLTREKVAAECLWPELPPEMQWQVRFVGDALDALPDGAITSGPVIGWRPDSPHGSTIEDILRRRDQKQLDALFAEEEVAAAYLYVVTAADNDDWNDVIESVREDVQEERHKAFLRDVKVFYSVETSATRNDLSLEFQEELWRMLGVLAGGLMYDPQEGEFELFEDDEDEEDDD